MKDSLVNHHWTASITSETLLQRAKDRDEKAWEVVISLYAPLVYRWCRKWGMKFHDIENLSQDVFALAFRNLDKFRKLSPDDSFRGWLYTIVKNKRVDWLRSEGEQEVALGGSDFLNFQSQVAQPIPSEEPDGQEKETKFLIERALALIKNEFSTRDWQIVQAIVMQNRPPRDISDELNVTLNIVYIVKSRVLKRLREEFSDLIDV